MAESNDDKTAANPNDISDADILAALEEGDHLLPEDEGSGDEGEAEVTEGAQEGNEVEAEDQPSGENAEEEAEAGEPESEDDKGTGEETEDEGDPEPQAKGIRDMEKRIDKLTAMRRGLEEENSALKEQLKTAQPIRLTPSYEDPLADLNTEQELDERRDQMVTLSRWCYENLDGGEVEKDGKTVEYTSKEVRQRLARAQETLGVHLPARQKYLQERASNDRAAQAAYPALFDQKSVESQIANRFLHQCPAIMRAPNYQLIIGDAIEGMKLRLARAAEKNKPKKEQIAPRATKPSQPAQKVASKANGNPRLARRFQETGSQNDLAALIESTL